MVINKAANMVLKEKIYLLKKKYVILLFHGTKDFSRMPGYI